MSRILRIGGFGAFFVYRRTSIKRELASVCSRCPFAHPDIVILIGINLISPLYYIIGISLNRDSLSAKAPQHNHKPLKTKGIMVHGKNKCMGLASAGIQSPNAKRGGFALLHNFEFYLICVKIFSLL